MIEFSDMVELNETFWNNFWSNFMASVLTGIIFSFIITFIVRNLKKPKLKVCLSVGSNVEGNSLIFYCVNTGNVGVMPNELKWKIYFPSAFQPTERFKEAYGRTNIDIESFNYVDGFNENSILPGDSTLLIYIPVKFNRKFTEFSNQNFESIEQTVIYYSITTTKGQKKYQKFFWDYFKKTKYIQDSSFIKRPIIQIKEKNM
mgnify:CR=1 FL=1